MGLKVSVKTDEELRDIIQDVNEAISANPETTEIHRYLVEREACKRELQERETKRMNREILKRLKDPLSEPFDYRVALSNAKRWHEPFQPWRACASKGYRFKPQAFSGACFNLGWRKLHPVCFDVIG